MRRNSDKWCFWLLILFMGVFSCEEKNSIFHEGYVTADSAKIYYRIFGNENGDPILIVHGGPGLDHTYMSPHFDKLQRNYKLIYYDQRAGGNSTEGITASSVTLNNFIEDIEAVRKCTSEGKVTLLAHSFGGLLAMKYAARYPENVKKLILVNSVGLNSLTNNEASYMSASRFTIEDKLERNAIVESEDFKNFKPETLVRYIKMGFKYQFYEKHFLDSLKITFKGNFAENNKLLQNLGNDLTVYNFEDDLKLITAPTFLIYGDYDPLSFDVAKKLNEDIQQSEYILFRNCGHFPFIEAEFEFLNAIDKIMKRG